MVLTLETISMPSELARYKNLCRYLENLMSDRGWSQQDLANAIQTRQPVISSWLNGKFSPSVKFRIRLAKLGGYSLAQFEDILNGNKPGSEQLLDLPETADEALPVLRKMSDYEINRLIIMLLEEKLEH